MTELINTHSSHQYTWSQADTICRHNKGRTSPKWPIWYGVGHKTLTQTAGITLLTISMKQPRNKIKKTLQQQQRCIWVHVPQ